MSWKERADVFLREVWVESKHKVTWPTLEELRESTMVVLATVAIISVFIFFVDHMVSWVITRIL